MEKVKQLPRSGRFLQKFVPVFTDTSTSLTLLTQKDIPFKLTKMCQDALNLLKKKLTESSILKYPNLEKPYTFFTDASKYTWVCILTQAYIHSIDGKEKTILHPITYVSELFKGSQCNLVAFNKDAYAI